MSDSLNFFGRETKFRKVFRDSQGRSVEFETRVLPSGPAAELLPSALDFLSGPVGAAAEVFSGVAAHGLAGAEVRAELVTQVLQSLASHVREVGGVEWFKTVLSATQRKHKDIWINVTDVAYYNDMFAGEMQLQLRVVLWVLEVNFGPFSVGVESISAAIKARIPAWLTSLSDLWSALGLTQGNGSGSDSGAPVEQAATPTP